MTTTRLLSFFVLVQGLLSATTTAQDYDFIVVGAGSAGSIVAGELAKQHGYQVLLVEAGGDDRDPSVQDMGGYFNVAFNPFNFGFLQWGLESTPQTLEGIGDANVAARTITLPMGKLLGGSHSINAAAFVQGHPSDFDRIAENVDDEDWTWKATARFRRYLKRKLDPVRYGKEQLGGEAWVATAEAVLGLPYNPHPLDGDQYGIGASYWTARPSEDGNGPVDRVASYETFAAPWTVRPHPKSGGKVDVVTFHQVETLLFEDPAEPLRVTGVRCQNTRALISQEFSARYEVILSAGTYNTPKILMLSGIGPADQVTSVGLQSRLDPPAVGTNLRDHYSAGTFWNLNDLPPDAPILFQSPTFNIFGPEKDEAPSFQMELSGTFGSITPLKASSAGSLTLVSTDPSVPMSIDPNILSTAEDVELYMTGFRTILIPFFESLVEQGFITEGNFRLDVDDAELQTFIVENVSTNHHPVGTCQIGKSAETAVVDANFRVFGTEGLRVVDASIFPLAPSGNSNAATMTAALLAVKKIAETYDKKTKNLLRKHGA